MARMIHLSKNNAGPACKGGKIGGNIRGEHRTVSYTEFLEAAAELRCAKCAEGHYFAFLQKTSASKNEIPTDEWEPEADDVWKVADDALIPSGRINYSLC